jgi:tRNA 5-methylaminomethyl-2-thiouridine biosynthesis bifunctional protein
MDTPDRRVQLQVGFGLGRSFLQAWHHWRQDPGRSARLDFIALTPAPPKAESLRLSHRGGMLQALAEALAAQWPPISRNLHRLGFEAGRVHLLLGVGAPMELLPQLQAQVHVFQVDEFDPASDPKRSALRLAKGLARLAAPKARLHASLAPLALQALRPALAGAGFQVAPAGAELRAVYQPSFEARRRGTSLPAVGEGHALIVGAGLAGCATAWALAEQGWSSTVIDRADAPATQGSGNLAGLFHGIVNPQDGAHARFNRAAALLTQRTVQAAIDSGTVRGSAAGLLRLDTRGLGVQALRDELEALQLPADFVQALDAAEASARCGLPLQHPAWFYPGGGWVQPAGLARWMLQQAGDSVRFRGGLAVKALRNPAGRWQLLDDSGAVLEEAASVVLANAADALRLLQVPHWPVLSVRGQISLCAATALPLPRLPLAGAGYLLPEIDGTAVFGASSQPADGDRAVREADHAFNLQRLAQLSPALAGAAPAAWQGRVGWRCVADDRLPLVGAVADEAAFARQPGERIDQVPRRPGLHVFSALGSRGIGWATLGAQVLAARLSGAPLPLETSLVEALDPARFALRAARRARRRD